MKTKAKQVNEYFENPRSEIIKLGIGHSEPNPRLADEAEEAAHP